MADRMITNTATVGSTAKPVERPYPPSWIDRLFDWVERLLIPAWLVYLGIFCIMVLARAAVAWNDGSYPVGTFFSFHVLQADSIYTLFVLHYLDKQAAAALAAYRPVLTVDDSGYERLHYQLTTMPARPLLVWSLAGLAFGLAIELSQPILISEAERQQAHLFTSPAATVLDIAYPIISFLLMALFIYHTIRQLRLISRIYTDHTTINIFNTSRLYVFSRVTALTALAVVFYTYLQLIFAESSFIDNPVSLFLLSINGIITIASFVWPLLGAHGLLQAEKARRIDEIARRLALVTDDLHRRVDTSDPEDINTLKTKLDALVVEQGIVAKVSTWPWEPEALRLVISAILLPVVLWALTRVLERLGF